MDECESCRSCSRRVLGNFHFSSGKCARLRSRSIQSRPMEPAGNGDSWGPWLGGLQPPGSIEPAGGWMWHTGEPFSFLGWNTGEPNNNAGNEDRIDLFGYRAPLGDLWNDKAGNVAGIH